MWKHTETTRYQRTQQNRKANGTVERVTVQLLDDVALQEGEEVDADHGEVLISLDGHDYELHLSSDRFGALQDALDPYIKVARRTGSKTTSRRGATATTSVYRPGLRVPVKTQSVGERVQEIIRRWAVEQGITVPSDGPIPTDVVRRYRRERRLVTRDDSQGGTVTGKTPLFSGADNGASNGNNVPALPKGGFKETKDWLTHQRRFAKAKGLACADKARVPTTVTEAWIIEYGLPEFSS